MQVREIMTSDVCCCFPDSSLQEVGQLMLEHDCGAIPVVEGKGSRKPSGIITDRDIVCRVIAEGKNPSDVKVGDVMTTSIYCVHPEDSEEECLHQMEQHKVRRMLVVDENGDCCGIVSQADFARKAPREETAELVSEISQPSGAAGSF